MEECQMGKLMAVTAVVVAGVLFSRRSTLKEDSKRLTASAKGHAANLVGRVRSGSEAGAGVDEATVVDLSDGVLDHESGSTEGAMAGAV
jgi:hypothetical protein